MHKKGARVFLYDDHKAVFTPCHHFYQMMRDSMYTPHRTTLCPRVRFDQRYQTPTFAWERIHQHIVAAGADTKGQSKAGSGRSYMAFVRRKGSVKKEKAKVVHTA